MVAGGHQTARGVGERQEEEEEEAVAAEGANL
jgi:hypothetical protein